ncbi:hypothetical protein STEG23_036294, partial [Scotinomys teguina]
MGMAASHSSTQIGARPYKIQKSSSHQVTKKLIWTDYKERESQRDEVNSQRSHNRERAVRNQVGEERKLMP